MSLITDDILNDNKPTKYKSSAKAINAKFCIGVGMWLKNILRRILYTVLLALLPDEVEIDGKLYNKAVIHDNNDYPGVTELVHNEIVYALIHRAEFELLAKKADTEFMAYDQADLSEYLLGVKGGVSS
jgi:hypothetical protein